MTAAVGASPRVLVINGGSSSGKSSLVRELQVLLPGVWLRLGVDALIEALPPSILDGDGMQLREDGEVVVGGDFLAVQTTWMQGVARMAELGTNLLIEDVFLSGPASQERWRRSLGRVPVRWVGVHCDPAVAADRERRRRDRIPGMAARQASLVHAGVGYDLEVDTTAESPLAVARRIGRHFFAMGAPGQPS